MGKSFPYEDTADSRVGELTVFHADFDFCMQIDSAGVIGGFDFPRGAENHAFALFKGTVHRHIVKSENDIL